MPALAIRQDLSAEELRRSARREPDRRAAMRLLAIANALGGLSRAEAARSAGMERQALRDAVLRYNAEGVDGLGCTTGPARADRKVCCRGSRPRSRPGCCGGPTPSGTG
jgi:hypothetical protein